MQIEKQDDTRQLNRHRQIYPNVFLRDVSDRQTIDKQIDNQIDRQKDQPIFHKVVLCDVSDRQTDRHTYIGSQMDRQTKIDRQINRQINLYSIKSSSVMFLIRSFMQILYPVSTVTASYLESRQIDRYIVHVDLVPSVHSHRLILRVQRDRLIDNGHMVHVKCIFCTQCPQSQPHTQSLER